MRSRAPRAAKAVQRGEAKPAPRAEAKEEVFTERAKSTASEDGERPFRKKKAKPSSYGAKSAKKSSSKSEAKAKDKVKKKAKAKKKKSNAKAKTE